MSDLAAFLLARIADDADAALEAQAHRRGVVTGAAVKGVWLNSRYHLTVDPARVLAECAAKRRIVELHATAAYHAEQFADAPEGDPFRTVYTVSLSTYDAVLRSLALPYADHPDFREEWRA